MDASLDRHYMCPAWIWGWLDDNVFPRSWCQSFFMTGSTCELRGNVYAHLSSDCGVTYTQTSGSLYFSPMKGQVSLSECVCLSVFLAFSFVFPPLSHIFNNSSWSFCETKISKEFLCFHTKMIIMKPIVCPVLYRNGGHGEKWKTMILKFEIQPLIVP